MGRGWVVLFNQSSPPHLYVRCLCGVVLLLLKYTHREPCDKPPTARSSPAIMWLCPNLPCNIICICGAQLASCVLLADRSIFERERGGKRNFLQFVAVCLCQVLCLLSWLLVPLVPPADNRPHACMYNCLLLLLLLLLTHIIPIWQFLGSCQRSSSTSRTGVSDAPPLPHLVVVDGGRDIHI